MANGLALRALRVTLRHIADCFVTPMATGMSLLACLLALRSLRPRASHVILTRVDQKSALKAVVMSGMTPVVVENVLKVLLCKNNTF